MRTPESNKQNQQKCDKCGRIVGCDYRGREHKCGCNQKGKEMKAVWALYIYEVKTALLRSMHKTEDGAKKALKDQNLDGFVMEYNLYD